MMPPWAQCVLVSLGSAARVTTVTGIPASASRRATVPPATPQPIISTSVSISSSTRFPYTASLQGRSPGGAATIHHVDTTGTKAALITGQEQHQPPDFLGCPIALEGNPCSDGLL